jgi:WD40 repeat protein
LWELPSGKEYRSLNVKGAGIGGSYRVAFSPDGQRLAAYSGADVIVWDAQTGRELVALKGHTGDVKSITFSPDGSRLATAANDATVRVWDAQNGHELMTLPGRNGGNFSSFISDGNSVAFRPDGHRLVAGSTGDTVKIWDGTPLAETR